MCRINMKFYGHYGKTTFKFKVWLVNVTLAWVHDRTFPFASSDHDINNNLHNYRRNMDDKPSIFHVQFIVCIWLPCKCILFESRTLANNKLIPHFGVWPQPLHILWHSHLILVSYSNAHMHWDEFDNYPKIIYTTIFRSARQTYRKHNYLWWATTKPHIPSMSHAKCTQPNKTERMDVCLVKCRLNGFLPFGYSKYQCNNIECFAMIWTGLDWTGLDWIGFSNKFKGKQNANKNYR